jgi:trk system potassium uptake protein TrkH
LLSRLPAPVVVLASFAGLIALGALLLRLPAASTGEPLTLLDSVFTATSAVCVTGLAVFDPGTRLTPFGQLVLLGLIQAGGLGLMTFAIFVLLLLGRQISFRDRLVIEDTMHHSPARELRRLIGYVLLFTFTIEAAGAISLWLRWRADFPAGRAAYLSVFHSISAFCNAGFSLFSDNLMRYRSDLATNLVVTGLIVIGGLGFLVNMELRDQLLVRLRGQRAPRLTLHTRIVLVVTAALLVAGTFGFLIAEWRNLLEGLPLSEKLLVAWFQGVTPRTAGFNTVDYGKAATPTLFFTIFLMFIGASPGSTGGGVKTTALGLLLALLRARYSGRGRAMLFGRTIPNPVMDRALSVTLLSWVLASAALLLLAASELGVQPHAEARPQFIQLMFETVSAFGTVGLSTGITPALTPPGKLLIVLLMFVGRLGPLTVALAAGRRRADRARFRYAEENVMVG